MVYFKAENFAGKVWGNLMMNFLKSYGEASERTQAMNIGMKNQKVPSTKDYKS